MSTNIIKPSPSLGLRAPERINDQHDLSQFDCGEPSLNDFLRNKALKNLKSKASISYVICLANTNTVVGYYSISVGAVARLALPKARQRNMPDPTPVAVLGRLALDVSVKGKGIGADLLRDAVLRAYSHSNESGCPALMVNALHQEAADFYQHYGFSPFPEDPLTLVVSLKNAPS